MPLAFDVTVFPKSCPIANGASASAFIDVRGAKRGSIYVPSGWTAASIAFNVQQRSVANQVSGAVTPAKIRTKAGTICRIDGIKTAEPGWYEIPDEVFKGPGWVSLVSTNTASEAVAAQGADQALVVCLVS